LFIVPPCEIGQILDEGALAYFIEMQALSEIAASAFTGLFQRRPPKNYGAKKTAAPIGTAVGGRSKPQD
jgi:hypothetical protein